MSYAHMGVARGECLSKRAGSSCSCPPREFNGRWKRQVPPAARPTPSPLSLAPPPPPLLTPTHPPPLTLLALQLPPTHPFQAAGPPTPPCAPPAGPHSEPCTLPPPAGLAAAHRACISHVSRMYLTGLAAAHLATDGGPQVRQDGGGHLGGCAREAEEGQRERCAWRGCGCGRRARLLMCHPTDRAQHERGRDARPQVQAHLTDEWLLHGQPSGAGRAVGGRLRLDLMRALRLRAPYQAAAPAPYTHHILYSLLLPRIPRSRVLIKYVKGAM